MSTATLTTKGRITIPVDVRRALKVESGDRVELVRVLSSSYGLKREQLVEALDLL